VLLKLNNFRKTINNLFETVFKINVKQANVGPTSTQFENYFYRSDFCLLNCLLNYELSTLMFKLRRKQCCARTPPYVLPTIHILLVHAGLLYHFLVSTCPLFYVQIFSLQVLKHPQSYVVALQRHPKFPVHLATVKVTVMFEYT
jgi:hypothetical protein